MFISIRCPHIFFKIFTAFSIVILGFCLSIANIGCASDDAEIRREQANRNILRFLQDWRGVWSGPLRTSPIGAADYTLHVRQVSHSIHLEMIQNRPDDDIRNEFALVNLDGKKPRVRARLELHGRTFQKDYLFSPERSGSEKATFCLAERGCKFGEITFTLGGKKRGEEIHLQVFSEERLYADATLRFIQRNIPAPRAIREKASLKRTRVNTSETDGSLKVTATEIPPQKATRRSN